MAFLNYPGRFLSAPIDYTISAPEASVPATVPGRTLLPISRMAFFVPAYLAPVTVPVVGSVAMVNVENRPTAAKAADTVTPLLSDPPFRVRCEYSSTEMTEERVAGVFSEQPVTTREPRADEAQVLHGNGIASDNTKENLRWGTYEENQADRMFHARNGNVRREPVQNVCSPVGGTP